MMPLERFFNEDCINGAKKHIPDDYVDLIISDPPYGIDGAHLDKHYNRNEKYVIDGYVEVPQQEYQDFSLKWIKEAARILRPGGSIYVVSGYTNLHHVLNALHSTDLVEINHLIWKYNFGVFTSKKYVSSHYHILFWQKPGGKPTFNTYCRYGDSEYFDDGSSKNYADREDVFVIDREYKPNEIKNKNELPFALLSKMILYSSNPGDKVCDLFLGGGSTAIVSKGLGRVPMGFEISKNAFEMATKRIDAIKEGSLLSEIRIPEKNMKTNSGKEWTQKEREELVKIINDCRGMSKKDTIDRISKQLCRGKWGIQNEIERLGIKIESVKKKNTATSKRTNEEKVKKTKGKNSLLIDDNEIEVEVTTKTKQTTLI